ncbi:hypothetical protein D3C75_1257490 [compost metagenome]
MHPQQLLCKGYIVLHLEYQKIAEFETGDEMNEAEKYKKIRDPVCAFYINGMAGASDGQQTIFRCNSRAK